MLIITLWWFKKSFHFSQKCGFLMFTSPHMSDLAWTHLSVQALWLQKCCHLPLLEGEMPCRAAVRHKYLSRLLSDLQILLLLSLGCRSRCDVFPFFFWIQNIVWYKERQSENGKQTQRAWWRTESRGTAQATVVNVSSFLFKQIQRGLMQQVMLKHGHVHTRKQQEEVLLNQHTGHQLFNPPTFTVSTTANLPVHRMEFSEHQQSNPGMPP